MADCITCHHPEPHDGAGIGVCRHPGCGCDGPCTAEDAAKYEWLMERLTKTATRDNDWWADFPRQGESKIDNVMYYVALGLGAFLFAYLIWQGWVR